MYNQPLVNQMIKANISKNQIFSIAFKSSCLSARMNLVFYLILIIILRMLSKVIKRTFATTGHLFTWGQTTYGWGRPANSQHWAPGQVPDFNNIVSVSTGEYHLGFVTSDNSAYTVGLSDNGRLGLGSATESGVPRKLTFEGENVAIKSISCGNRHSLALSTSGEVYAWGYGGAVGVGSPEQVKAPVKISSSYFQNHKIVRVGAARDFSVALCDQGHFYAWGIGLQNIPDWSQRAMEPVQIKEVAELIQKRHAKIKKFAAIDNFILILLDNGRIYCRGTNNGGVFGARTNPLVMSDYELNSFSKTHDELYKNQKIVDFEASSNSLIFRTESDKIFYTGMYVKYQPTPFPLSIKAKKIFATDSSVGIVGEDNKLYFLNQKLIDESQFVCKTNRVFVSEDDNLNSDILAIGGDYALRYALVK